MKNVLKYINYIMAGLGALAFIMLFLGFAGGEDEFATGFECAFGYSEKVMGQKIEIFTFSFLNLLPILLTIAVIALALLNQFKPNKYFIYAIVGCAFVAAIFFFLSKGLVQFPSEYADYAKELREELELGAGAILAGIFSLFAAGAGVLKILFDKK